jgi:hypothetical protein
MTLTIPVALVYALGVFGYLVASFVVLIVRSIGGSHERRIVAILIALGWPVLLLWCVARAFIEKPGGIS